MTPLRAPAPALAAWQALPDAEVAAWIAGQGATTALCMDATRRWFHFDYLGGGPPPADPRVYLTATAGAYADLLTLLADQGMGPLFVPIEVPLRRGVAYAAIGMCQGLTGLLHHPRMVALYSRLRVRTYGPWPRLPAGFEAVEEAFAGLRTQFEAITARTALNTGPRLWWRIQLNLGDSGAAEAEAGALGDPVTDLLAVAGAWQAAAGRIPTRRELLTAFYHLDPDESLPPLRLLISAQLKDPVGRTVPPLLGGREDLYFTVGSPLSLDRAGVRAILYDWLFVRHRPPEAPPVEYEALSAADRASVAAWYARYGRQVWGLGLRQIPGDFWVPHSLNAGNQGQGAGEPIEIPAG
jgi:hypothetical protein